MRVDAARSVRRRVSAGADLRVTGRVWVRGGGKIRLGARVCLDAAAAGIELHVRPGGELSVDDDVYVAPGVSIEVLHSVVIGARVRIGPLCKIMDAHFHALEGDRRVLTRADFVVVEEDVDVGPHAILLPRADIGRSSTVIAGSVLSRRFAPRSIIGGSPAIVRGRR